MMSIQTINSLNNQINKTFEKIPFETIESAIAQAEKRLETWLNKSYYERVALLANIADHMPNKTDQLSKLITLEINKLLAQSSVEIALL